MDMSQSPVPSDHDPTIQQFRHSQVGARVPERLARGVYSNGVIVMRVGSEFILDFVQRMTRPYMVNARVVVPSALLPQFISALRRNLDLYEQKWGTPKEPPKPEQPVRQPSFQEVYDDLKMPEDVQSGAFANALIVSHTPTDFCLDFVTTFFPYSAVSARVFMGAGQVPGLIQSLSTTYEHFRRQMPPETPRNPSADAISDTTPQTKSPPKIDPDHSGLG